MKNPKISMVVLCYNQDSFIRETILSCLNQDSESLEIIISDDCSTDSTVSIIEHEIDRYAGPHDVRFVRNERNLGLVENLNSAISLARGEVVVLCGGDDLNHPSRCEDLYHFILKNNLDLAFSGYEMIDFVGAPCSDNSSINQDLLVSQDPKYTATSFSLYIGAAGAISSRMIERFGPISTEGTYEDLIFGYRASLCNGVGYLEKKLVKYRVNVGISFNNNKGSDAYREKQMKLELRTLEQRLLDTALLTPRRFDLERQLRYEISRLKAKINSGDDFHGRKLFLSNIINGFNRKVRKIKWKLIKSGLLKTKTIVVE